MTPSFAKYNHLYGLEIRQLLRPLRRWWWLLLIVPLVSGLIAYYMVGHGAVYYQAQVLLSVGPAINQPIETDVPPLVITRLGVSYSQLVMQDEFLRLVSQQSTTNLSVDEIRQATVVQFNPDTSFFELHVVTRGAARSLGLLQTISKLLTDQTPTSVALRLQSRQTFITTRRQQLAQLIQADQQKLSDFNNQGAVAGADSISSNTAQIRNDLSQYNQEVNDLNTVASAGDQNQIQIVEQPHLVQLGLGPQPKSSALALAAMSLTLCLALVYVLEMFFGRLYAEQVEAMLGQKILLNLSPVWRKRKYQDDMQPYDLLAAELIATSSSQCNAPGVRLLIIYEQYTPLTTVKHKIGLLAEALTRLGNRVTIFNTSETLREASIIGSFALPQPGNGDEWELTVQVWPDSLHNLRRLSETSATVLVLCSLQFSSKRNLTTLTHFLQTSGPEVNGIILV